MNIEKAKAKYLSLHSLMEADRKGELDQYIKENRQCVDKSNKMVARYRRELESQSEQRVEISIKDVQRIEFHSNF